MRIPVEALKPVLIKWIDDVVLPATSSTLAKWGITLGLMQLESEGSIETLLKQGLGVFADSEGKIDADKLFTNAKAALNKVSPNDGLLLDFKFFKWQLDESDLNKAYEIYKAMNYKAN